MKKIAVLLALYLSVLTSARAEAIASMPNEGGGEIVLTNEVCVSNGKTFEGLRKLYYYTSTGDTGKGCYYYADDLIHAIWESGNEKKYPANRFTVKRKNNL